MRTGKLRLKMTWQGESDTRHGAWTTSVSMSASSKVCSDRPAIYVVTGEAFNWLAAQSQRFLPVLCARELVRLTPCHLHLRNACAPTTINGEMWVKRAKNLRQLLIKEQKCVGIISIDSEIQQTHAVGVKKFHTLAINAKPSNRMITHRH